MSKEFDFSELATKLAENIIILKRYRYNSVGKWIVASKDHVFVGDGAGINGSGFDVRGVLHSNYPEYASFDEALRHINPYLIDGGGRPINNKPMKATTFYDDEIKVAEWCRAMIKNAIV